MIYAMVPDWVEKKILIVVKLLIGKYIKHIGTGDITTTILN